MSSRLGVLLSGRGSNFLAIAKTIESGALDATISIVVSNREDAPGIDRARDLGLAVAVVPHRAFATRLEHEQRITEVLRDARVEIVVLAGYMRKLETTLLEAFPAKILNIHPSLLPAFPGVDAQRQALEHGVKVTGCTVHIVDESLDGGPIVVQRAVPVLDDDTVETLSARILVEEHIAYVEALRLVTKGVRIVGRRVTPLS